MSYQPPHLGWHFTPYGYPSSPNDVAAQSTYGYGYPPQQPKKNNGVVIAVVVGAVALVVVAFMVFVAPLIFIGKTTSDINELISESTGGNTEQILKNELDVKFGTFIRDDRYTTLIRGKLPVTIRNKGGDRATYHVQIEAVDAAGNRIAEDTVFVQNLGPGQSVTEEAFKLTDEDDYYKLTRATFRVAGVSKY
jgi:hypothetical protein